MPHPNPRHRPRAQAVAELLDHIAQSFVTRAGARGLTPVQRAAVRYIGRADDAVRTVRTLAAFQTTARSNAARTIGALVKAGLMIKVPAPDGRERALVLTTTGRRVLAEDPVVELTTDLQTLTDDALLRLAEAVDTLADKVLTRR